MSAAPREVELLVVGAGPAGLAAAAEATAAGVQVTLADAAPATGGQFYARRPAASWSAGLPERLIAGMREELLELRLQTSAWGAFGDVVALARGESSEAVRPQAIVLATGGYERPLPFPGWDGPSVVAPGALQRMLKVARVVPDGSVAVAGSGPFLLAVAADLRAAGVEVAAIVERRRRRELGGMLPMIAGSAEHRRQALRFARLLRGVPQRFGVSVREAHERGLTLSDGSEVAARVVCVGHGFLPRTELARMLGVRTAHGGVEVNGLQETTRDGVFAAGEATGIGGALLAEAEGRLAGFAAVRRLRGAGAHADSERERELRSRRDRYARFARRLAAAYTEVPVLDAVTPATIVCRCERVTAGELERARAMPSPADDPRAAKAELRCGMGPCQGAMCSEAVRAFVAFEGEPGSRREPRVRPPLGAVTVGALAEAEDVGR